MKYHHQNVLLLTKFLMKDVIDVLKIYIERGIFEDLEICPHHYILKPYKMVNSIKDGLTYLRSILSLLELTKLSITHLFKDSKNCDELFKEFPYNGKYRI
jgi:hypothetical protein